MIVVVLLARDHRLKALAPRVAEIETKMSESDPNLSVIEIDLRSGLGSDKTAE